MGMFDWVVGKCPGCGEKIEMQSKGGRCELKRYSLTSVPISVAADLMGLVYTCKKCGDKSEVLPVSKPSFYLAPVVDEESEYDEPEYN